MEAQKLILLTGVNSRMAGSEPAPDSFGEFLRRRECLGASIHSGAQKLVCIDYSHSVAQEIRKLSLVPDDCSLIQMEPSVVLPANYKLSRKRQFKKIITVGGPPSRDSFSVHWPLIWPSASELAKLLETERTDRVVLINGNKMSFVKGELYSLRRGAITAIGNLDLYGTEWDSSATARLFIALRSFVHSVLSLELPQISGLSLWLQPYPKSQGPVTNKLQTMSRYKYALVIENSAEYMSEKLMEALFAGCIPIYVGPDPKKYGIPKELVIRAQPSLSSIQEGLTDAQGWNIEDFHARLLGFLSSSAVRDLWDHTRVYERVLQEIQNSN